MESTIQGKVFKFGDNINSDIIIPGRYLIYIEPEKLALHAFEVLGAEFSHKLRQFQIIVAGRNFGCGSAREQAVTAIQGLGIKAVIAASFARTFYRNAINSGLPIIECPELLEFVQEGDELRIDLKAAQINIGQKTYPFPKFPDSVRRLLELGGLAEYLKAQQQKAIP
jgi:3-isopropylmalate/(R)-2-methylmalate dehydratase small subunit